MTQTWDHTIGHVQLPPYPRRPNNRWFAVHFGIGHPFDCKWYKACNYKHLAWDDRPYFGRTDEISEITTILFTSQ